MHEAANQKVLDRQLEQLEEARAFATRTLGETDNRPHAEQALAVWYVKKYGEKLRPSHTTQIVRDAALALQPARLVKQITDHTLSKRWLFGMSKSTARN